MKSLLRVCNGINSYAITLITERHESVAILYFRPINQLPTFSQIS